MKHCFRACALVLVLLLGSGSMPAQTISIERVDAPPSSGRSHFITATLAFSVRIVVSNVNQCTGVSFELRYNNAGSVRLSGWSTAGSFQRSGIVVIDESNQVSGQGSISVGALSQVPVSAGGQSGTLNVVQLDFVVTPNAVHNSNTVFSFMNPEAIVADNGGTILRMAGQPAIYNVHGFIDVWPGDANNDGIVNSRDISSIGLFFDDGDPSGRIRGFSRNPASTIWSAQTALAWDSVRVTYADCDGSGRVDIDDVLVVFQNFTKTHTAAKKGGNGDIERAEPMPQRQSAESILIPVELTSGDRVLGVSTRVSWQHVKDKFRVLGVVPGPLFSGAQGFFQAPGAEGTSHLDFALGYFYPAPEITAKGIIAYLEVEPLGSETSFSPVLSNSRGVARGGSVFPLGKTISSVGEPEALHSFSARPNPARDMVQLGFTAEQAGMYRLHLVDALGNTLAGFSRNVQVHAGENSFELALDGLAGGTYYLRLSGPDAAYGTRLLVMP